MKTAPFFLLALTFAAAAQLRAQIPSFDEDPPLKATLVSEVKAAKPGEAFRVAVKLEHKETWHSYGKTLAPGVVGKPTELKWELPEGWTVEDLEWPPTHEVQSTGGAKSDGYDGTVYLPARITPAAGAQVGGSAQLKVTVDALVCDPSSCVPARPAASLSLPLAAEAERDPAAAEAFEEPLPVRAALVSEVKAAAPGEPFRVAVKLMHNKGWHSYGKKLPADGTGETTVLTWGLPDGWKAEELEWPPVRELPSAGGEMAPGYGDVVYLPVRLTPPASAVVGSKASLKVNLKGLVCDPENCVPFKLQAIASISIAATAQADPAAADAFKMDASGGTTGTKSGPLPKNWLLLVLYAFLGGLILNVMPCVFPVLGIKIVGFVNQAGEDKRKVLLHGLAYTAGVLICFWVLAGLIIFIRSQGKDVAWGAQLQSPPFVFGLIFFLFVFALNMAGLFEVGTSAVGVGQELQARSGLPGSFFSGLLATVVATPCAAPFLAPALAFAFTLPAAPSLGFFTVIGLGLASPYLVLSAFPHLVKLLPRPGPWMESFKQFMSFLLFGTVVFLLWTFEGFIKAHFDDHALLWVGLGLVLVAMACWIYGRWCPIHKPARTRLKGYIAAGLALVLGIWIGWPGKPDLAWEEWSPELEQKYRLEEKAPVYVDFTARWCVTCQTNKRVYKNAGLKRLFDQYDVKLLKADWTNYDERITRALEKLERAAIPVNVLYIPGQEEPYILPNLLTVDNVSEALKKLEKK